MPGLSPSSNGQNTAKGISPVTAETTTTPKIPIPQGQVQPRPVDIFVLKTNGHISVLDCVFISKRSKRAVYATITRGAETTVWRAASSGTLTQIARIEWEHDFKVKEFVGDGSLRSATQTAKKASMLTFDGKSIKVEDFLRKGRGWFSSDSKTFTMDDMEYKWKPGMDGTGASDGQTGKNANTPHQEAWKVWRCTGANNSSSSPVTLSPSHRPAFQFPIVNDAAHVATGATPEAHSESPSASASAHGHGPSSGNGSGNRSGNGSGSGNGRPSISSPSATLSRSSYAEAILGQVAIASAAGASVPGKTPPTIPPALLARFSPPQKGLARNELVFYSALFTSSKGSSDLHLLEGLLLSAILLAVGKAEWKEVQSVVDAPALQAVFVAEAAGEVPPYTPRAAVKQPERPFTRVRSNSGPPPRGRPEDSPFTAIPVDNSERRRAERRGSLRIPQSQSRPHRGQSRNASPGPGTGTSVGNGIGMATNVGVGIGVGVGVGVGTPTSNRESRAAGSHSAPPSQRHMRPATAVATADNHRAGDGFFAPRRPSLRVTTVTPAPPFLSRGDATNTYGGIRRPSSDPANRGHATDLTDTKEEFSGPPPAYE